MFITGLGTAVPAQCYSQGECWEAINCSPQFAALEPRAKALLRKVLLGDNGIEQRHLALSSLDDAFRMDPDTLHGRFLEHAPALATQAAKHALRQAGQSCEEIDALIISTCTGYLCPGLTSYVSERLNLRTNALLLDLVGQGCGAALPNLQTAAALLASGQCEHVLSICVEVCSAAFYLDNDPGVLVSACLFGDGAAAAVLSRQPGSASRPVRWRTAASLLSAADRDQLRFEHSQGLLRNILTRQVPALAAQHARTVLESALRRMNVTSSDISAWILHPGGRDVLRALQQSLQLPQSALQHSAAILRDHGNMSSASVLFVLQSTLTNRTPAGYWWLSSFGAGFTCHGALLEVH